MMCACLSVCLPVSACLPACLPACLDYDDAGQCWEVAIKHAGKKFSIEDTDGTYMNTNHFNLRTTAFFVYWWSSEPRATALPPGCLTLEPEEGHTVTVTGGAGGT